MAKELKKFLILEAETLFQLALPDQRLAIKDLKVPRRRNLNEIKIKPDMLKIG